MAIAIFGRVRQGAAETTKPPRDICEICHHMLTSRTGAKRCRGCAGVPRSMPPMKAPPPGRRGR